jgi:hypothetical protein
MIEFLTVTGPQNTGTRSRLYSRCELLSMQGHPGVTEGRGEECGVFV